MVKGELKILGNFDTVEEAEIAYLTCKKEAYPEAFL